MSDRYDENLVLDYLEGDLSPQDRAHFETLLAQDAPLRRLVESLQQDRAHLRELPTPEPPAQLMEPIHQRLERQMLLDPAADQAPIPIVQRRMSLVRWTSVAAVAALLVVVGGLVVQTLWWTIHLPQSPASSASGPVSTATPLAQVTPAPDPTEAPALADARTHHEGVADPGLTYGAPGAEAPGPSRVEDFRSGSANTVAPAAALATNQQANLRLQIVTHDAAVTRRDLDRWVNMQNAQVAALGRPTMQASLQVPASVVADDAQVAAAPSAPAAATEQAVTAAAAPATPASALPSAATLAQAPRRESAGGSARAVTKSTTMSPMVLQEQAAPAPADKDVTGVTGAAGFRVTVTPANQAGLSLAEQIQARRAAANQVEPLVLTVPPDQVGPLLAYLNQAHPQRQSAQLLPLATAQKDHANPLATMPASRDASVSPLATGEMPQIDQAAPAPAPGRENGNNLPAPPQVVAPAPEATTPAPGMWTLPVEIIVTPPPPDAPAPAPEVSSPATSPAAP